MPSAAVVLTSGKLLQGEDDNTRANNMEPTELNVSGYLSTDPGLNAQHDVTSL